MNVSLLAYTQDADILIEKCGRVCYDSKDKTTPKSAEKFIHMLIERGHDSVLEHASITFLVTGISRALSHQLVRHRVGCSYSQRSQRYVKEDKVSYIVPESIKNNSGASELYYKTMGTIRQAYNDLMNIYKVKPEDARFVLPNACETELSMTMNFRALRHFLRLRLDPHAQWEIRNMAMEMLRLAYSVAPYSFEDMYTQYLKGLDIAVGRV